jgi:hypothetical protein
MKRSYQVLLAFTLITLQLSAQNAADALRLSLQDPTGTARFAGAGGAFTALGSDYGAITINPAGAAMYRSDEFVLSSGLRFHETQTTLNGTSISSKERRNHFNLDALGLVFNRSRSNGKWTTFNTVIGYNRTANYNRKYYYEGQAKGSLINSYYDDAVASGGNNPDNYNAFGAGMAYEANALYANPAGALTSDFQDNRDAQVLHNQYVSERGGAGELHFGFAGNYKERLMIGLTAGVPLTNYSLNSNYTETDEADAVPYFNSLTLNETVRSEAVGFNMKLGLIYRATQALRIGAAFHTPSFLAINDSFKSDFSYAYTDGNGPSTTSATSPDGLFDYKLNTPFRTSVGAAYLFGSRGFLSGDVEIVDYANAVFNFTSDVNSASNAALERELNRDIEQAYTSAVNLKVGGEFAHEELRLRAGMQRYGNPNAKGGDDRMIYTAGIGYRGDDFYLDLAYRKIQSTFSISPYQAGGNTLVARSDAQNNDFLLTLGFRF